MSCCDHDCSAPQTDHRYRRILWVALTVNLAMFGIEIAASIVAGSVSVRADAPWKTWDEFVNYSKAHPGKVSFASPGIGTSLHLTMEDLSGRLGIQWLHVPYKGSADAVAALRGSQVMALCEKSGESLAASSASRIKAPAAMTSRSVG